MKKRLIVLLLVLVGVLLLAVPAMATQPLYGTGTWDDFSFDDQNIYYDLHGVVEGTVVQPIKPGRAQKAYFVGTVDGVAGECWTNVVTFNENGEGSGTFLWCTGDLAGLQGRTANYLDDPVNFTGSYEFWYHFPP